MLNELTEAALLYHVLVFTPWYTDDDMKENVGYFFNGTIVLNMVIHFLFLLATYYRECRSKYRQKKCCC